jgi:hypothetical protein
MTNETEAPQLFKKANTKMKNAKIKNTGMSILWLQQQGDLQMMLPDSKKIILPVTHGGALVRDDGELTAEQWRSRTPEMWGILAANNSVDVLQFPCDEDEKLYMQAKEKEEKRLAEKFRREEVDMKNMERI